MKVFLFAALIALANSVLAADAVVVIAEQIRDGELVDKFSIHISDSATRQYRDVQLINYRVSKGGQVRLQGLEVGTVGSFAVEVQKDAIKLNIDLKYDKLMTMGSIRQEEYVLDYPKTMGCHIRNTQVATSGEVVSYPCGDSYYKITAALATD
ncbi:hypothetical protein ACXX81_12925 [Pseudomonas sp. GNP013]